MENSKHEKKTKFWKRKPFIISAIISVVVIVVVTIIVVLNVFYIDGKYRIVHIDNGGYVGDIYDKGYVKRWDDKNTKEKYTSVKYNDNNYGVTLSFYESTDIKYIGEKIGNGQATGYDEYEKIYHTVDVEIYNILKVNNDVSIAVKFFGDDNYYSYCNWDYDFGNIGNFVESLNLKEYATFGKVDYWYQAKDGKYYNVYFDNVDKNAIIDTFFGNNDTEIVQEDVNAGYRTYSFGFSVEAIGRCNLSIMVYSNGKVVTNLFGYGRIFDIGEKGQEFLDYLNKNYRGYVNQ